ncbi:MAG: antA/AntB antirepressor family protein [Planctomycetaceae bacterium]|jgi:anti-repressor protein|nr:antA/AntB antirepressor family protein [Planctomycetaceae bacterium]
MTKNELIAITENEAGEPAVSERELYEFLEVETPYLKWFQRMCEYGFTEGKDYQVLVPQICLTNNPRNPVTKRTDHAISLGISYR